MAASVRWYRAQKAHLPNAVVIDGFPTHQPTVLQQRIIPTFAISADLR